ncbi:hypothetical protein BD413DRAFT_601399 [Trametes elegans]|nr:hypothetical protein BD413DRAFT_601399 [Trametes elegans]
MVFSIVAPVLTSPLLKIPILVPDAVLTYISLTPPNPTPPKEELQKYANTDWYTKNRRVQTKVITVCKAALIGLMAAESATILAQAFPSAALSSRVLAVLAPGNAPLPLRPSARSLVAGVLVLAAGAVRAWTYRTLGRFFRWELSVQHDHRLVTTGPYAYVRHPSYVASTLVSYGNLLLLSGPGTYFTEAGIGRSTGGKVVAGAIAAYLLWLHALGEHFFTVPYHAHLIVGRVEKEDEVMKQQFGDEWGAWAKKTPYKLIPYIY